MDDTHYQQHNHSYAAAEEETGVIEEHYPVEELIPNSVRFGRDPQSLAHPLDPSIYGYDIAQMKERPWAKPGVDTSDYFNYGFDEESWRAYCALQAQGIKSLRARADKFVAEILGSQSGPAAYSAQGQGGQGGGTSGGFSHTPNYGGHMGSNTFGGHRDGQREPREQSKFYKTQMCQGYLNGSCNRGPTCNYAHGQHELRQYVHPDRAPGTSGSGSTMGHGIAGAMPPPVPIPMSGGAMSGNMQIPIPMPMGMPLPPPPLGMVPVPMPPIMGSGGEGVLSAPPVFVPPTVSSQPQVSKGPAGFRILPQQKRDREKSPENVTY